MRIWQSAELKNVGESPLTWRLQTSGVKRVEDETFRLVSASGAPLTLPPADISPPGVGELGYLAPQESCRFSVQCRPGEYIHCVHVCVIAYVHAVLPGLRKNHRYLMLLLDYGRVQ